MRLELITYLFCAFLPLNISATTSCSEDTGGCCINKYEEMGCCPYNFGNKNFICCDGGQCCPAGMKCNLDKLQCEYKMLSSWHFYAIEIVIFKFKF